MKLVERNERSDISGIHNDRNFDLSKAVHINPDRGVMNKYWVYNDEYHKKFIDIEKEFYEKNFGEFLSNQERRLKENHNYSKIKSVDDYLKGRYTKPEDKILQIGNSISHIDGKLLWEIANDYQKRFNDMFGDNCKIIDMALHMDELVPHVHIRRVWMATNDYGEKVVSQTKALNELGINRPNMSKESSRNNNAKMTFSKIERELLFEICKEHGLDLDKKPNKENDIHIRIDLIRERTVNNELEKIIDKKNELENELEESEQYLNSFEYILSNMLITSTYWQEEIKKTKKLDLTKRAKALKDIYEKTIVSAMEQLEKNKVNVDLYNIREIVNAKAKELDLIKFIKENGLYENYLAEHELREYNQIREDKENKNDREDKVK